MIVRIYKAEDCKCEYHVSVETYEQSLEPLPPKIRKECMCYENRRDRESNVITFKYDHSHYIEEL